MESCCINAGAGAGKTSYMVQAYMKLLANQRPPEQIVVITFTEKAAAELKQRLGRALLNDKALLAKLQWAPISTIHSFCVRLLREFGPHIGLDPAFTVLDAIQFQQLISESLGNLLKKGLQQGWTNLAPLLQKYKLDALRDILRSLLYASYINGLTPEEIAAQSMLSLDYEREIREIRQRQSRRMRFIGDELQTLCAGAKTPQYVKSMAQLPGAWLEYENSGLIPPTMMRLLQGSWGKYNDLKNEIRADIKALLQIAVIPQANALSDSLLELFQSAYLEVEEELAARSALSFDHLLLRAASLFKPELGLQKQLRQKYPIIMVDEFQDVNPLQAALIADLAGLAAGSLQNRLLVVGDRKQSIYGFRGADVEVFSRINKSFELLGNNMTIDNNYRSSSELISFFNAFFANQVFAQQVEHDFQVQFSEADKQRPGHERLLCDSNVEIWDCRLPGHNIAERRQAEARTMAARIQHMLEPGRAAAGDIVILLRSLTNVDIYAKALQEAAIPYYVEQGRNFYQQREVLDLAMGLAALSDASDRQAWTGLLLGPVFAISPEGVWAIGQQAGKNAGIHDLIDKIEEIPQWLSPADQNAWRIFYDFFKRIKDIAFRMQPAELIGALLQDSGWLQRLAMDAHGAQKLANLRKLLEISREAPQVINGGLLGNLEEMGQEPLAPLLGAEAGVVRLMTIHQAKGLEFPIVIIPDLESARPRAVNVDFFLNSQGQLALKLNELWAGEKLNTPLFEKEKQNFYLKEEAESRRIFYVACTRAIRKLVFCLSADEKSPSLWSQWVGRLVQDNAIDGATDETIDGTIKVLPPLNEANPHRRAVELKEEGNMELARRIIQNCQPITIDNNLYAQVSVSLLEEWMECPRKGWFRLKWGIDWARMPQPAPPSPGRGNNLALPAWQLGDFVHKTMELVDFSKAMDEMDELQAALQRAAIPAQYRQSVFLLAASFWQTKWPAELKSYATLMREQTFSLLLEDGPFTMELKGEMDLLGFSPDKPPLIIDYKAAPPDQEKYAAQMACYALACAKAGALPLTLLCFLGEECRVLEKRFTSQELANWEKDVIFYGKMIAQAPDSFEKLPPGAKCDPQCQLHYLCGQG